MSYVEGPRGQQAPGGGWFFALKLEESRVNDMLFGGATDGDTVGFRGRPNTLWLDGTMSLRGGLVVHWAQVENATGDHCRWQREALPVGVMWAQRGSLPHEEEVVALKWRRAG